MDRIAEILAILNDESQRAELTDEQLAELRTELNELSEQLAADPTDENLEALDDAATAAELIDAEVAARDEDSADRESRAAAALQRIRGADTGTDGEGDEGEGATTTTDGEGDEGEGGAAEDAPEQLAAAATSTPARVSRVAARRPQLMTPRTPQRATDPSAWGLVASANVAGFAAGERLDDAGKIAAAFLAAIDSTRGYRVGPRVKVPVARAGSQDATAQYGEERFLTADAAANERKINALTSMSALAASGGICAPQQSRYDLPVIGDDDRPFRDDALANFGADRGGVKTLPVPILSDLDGAVGIWTEANDQTPASPTTKPCLTVTCPDDEDETLVDAITLCLEFGVFRQRYFAEQIEAWMHLAAVNHARRAETKLMTAVGSGSTQVNSGQLLGATRDTLTTLDRAVAQMRSRWRINSAFPLHFAVPFWLIDMIRADLVRELPGSADDRLATADATILAWIKARNVNLSTFLDGETGQVYGAQGDGPLNGWKSTVVTYLYPEGSWLFLDGGSLDLGIIRDTTTVATNDVQMFSETFENVHFHGVESYRLTLDLCPNGWTSAPVDIDPCTIGS